MTAPDPPARLCARPSCAGAAAATMTYQYAVRTVWIDPLDRTADPSGYDLCRAHAEATRVPVGWTRVDRRHGQLVLDGLVASTAPLEAPPAVAPADAVIVLSESPVAGPA